MSCKQKVISIKLSTRFKRELRRLSKKYRSLPQDVDDLIALTMQDPAQGASLGRNLHKVRLAITSKGGGKSGGARVITHVVMSYESGVVRFLTIYDKSECSTLADKELIALLKENGLI